MNTLCLPVNLPKEAIVEFIALYRKHYSVELPFAKGKIMAEKFMKLFLVVTQPIPLK